MRHISQAIRGWLGIAEARSRVEGRDNVGVCTVGSFHGLEDYTKEQRASEMSREERAAEIKATGLISHFPRHGWDESRIAKYICSQAEVGEREAAKNKPNASLLGRGADPVEKMLKLRGDYPAEKVDMTVRPLVVLDLLDDEEAKSE